MYKVFRFFYHLLRRVSPFLASFAFGLVSSISGRRHDELKRHVTHEARKSAYAGLSVSRSLERLEMEAGHRSSKIAFLSPMPPEDTGIATCSLYSFLDSEHPFDLFTLPVSDEDYLINSLRLKGGNACLYHANLLLYAHELFNYEAIIIAVGNSHHNFYVWGVLERLKKRGLLNKCTLYVHDPVLNNLAQEGRGLSAREYLEELCEVYDAFSEKLGPMRAINEGWMLQAELFRNSIYGLRVFRKFGLSSFLVNSSRAAEMVAFDLAGTEYRCQKIFHPVFSPTRFSASNSVLKFTRQEGVRYIGTFGVPGFSKSIDKIIEAVEAINQKHFPVRLVVAGFEVKSFFDKYPSLLTKNVITYDSPEDAHLFNLMKAVDLAIQLRAHDAGESSGVVPQLLFNGTTTIVSPVGAFREYGEAVIFHEDNGQGCLEKLIVDSLLNPKISDHISEYIARKTPSEFREELVRLYVEPEVSS